jgi:hypothetical protein
MTLPSDDNLPAATTIHLGYIFRNNAWQQTPATPRYATLWNATRLLAQLLHADQQHAATRISNHPSKITSIIDETLGYARQTLLVWEQHQTHPYPYTIPTESNTEFLSLQKSLPNFTIQSYIQLLFTAANISLPSDDNVSTQEPQTTPPITNQSPATLETIVEETEEDLQSNYAISVYNSKDEQLVQAGKQAIYYLQLETEAQPIERLSSEDRFRPDRLVYPEVPIYDVQLAPPHYHLLCGNRNAKKDYGRPLHDNHYLCLPAPQWADIELAYSRGQHGAYYDTQFFHTHFANFDPTWTEYIYVEHYLAAEDKKAVIERDTDLLTQQEIIQHKDQVNAAILAEIKTWIKYKCFERRQRSTARNIVDCKWVIKWKHEVLPDGTTRRIIRARLTIRGFKDQDAHDLIRYAGTSQRYSQRMLVSEAANRRWNIVSTNISKAFLQGVAYKELAEITGELLRDVNFYLPPSSIAVLKQIEGYTSFDPATEVLHSLKPSTGSVDAPRCFQSKLLQITLR